MILGVLSEEERRVKPLLKEVILENFMSYEYARIPFKPGLNIICGPNGAGKSSILVGISVALGQASTERSKRLADLIRRGKDIARITLIFDNGKKDGGRPLPSIRRDEFTITRYLRRDGEYWYQLNYTTVSKAEVEALLSEFGIDPENMLIVMHQYMVEEFIVLNPQNKLILVEKATGLYRFRERILEAEKTLQGILSEEKSVRAMLNEAKETLEKWREEYERLRKKRELIRRREELNREYLWSLFFKQDRNVEQIKRKIKGLQENLRRTEELCKEYERRREESWNRVNEYLFKFRESILNIEDVGEAEVEKTYLKLRDVIEEYATVREREAIQRYKMDEMRREIKIVERNLRESLEELKRRREEAEKLGPMIETSRSPEEIWRDLEANRIEMKALGEVVEGADEVYEMYRKNYEDLLKKAEEVEENRKRAMKEVEERKKVWRRKIEELIKEVNEKFRENLSRIDAYGRVRLINLEDVEEAGLELLVGFRGASPVILDYYTQSGGERSASIMAFLLALQSRILSPIRAVDEFDVHMDRRNMEAFLRMIAEYAENNPNVNYICITPREVPLLFQRANIIVVQNVRGASKVGVVEEEE